MSRYRKIETRIWNDEKFTALADDAKLVFLFLLTHPNLTMLGAMRTSVLGLAGELLWTPERFAKAFLEVSAKGMARYDIAASFVWLPNFMKYNHPEAPNVVKAWPKAMELLPECELKRELFIRLASFAKDLTKGFREAFHEAFPKTMSKSMPNQEQEQEQEQENTSASPSAPQSEEELLSPVQDSARPRVRREEEELSTEERIYKLYPVKAGKRKAMFEIAKAIQRVRNEKGWNFSEAVSFLHERTKTFAASPTAKRGEYIPYPATWFHQGRYEDDERVWQRGNAKHTVPVGSGAATSVVNAPAVCESPADVMEAKIAAEKAKIAAARTAGGIQ